MSDVVATSLLADWCKTLQTCRSVSDTAMTQGIVAVHTRRVVVRAGVGDGVIVG